MGSSFTGYRGHGFWARDGILATWLEALAEVVPGDAPAWLRDALICPEFSGQRIMG